MDDEIVNGNNQTETGSSESESDIATKELAAQLGLDDFNEEEPETGNTGAAAEKKGEETPKTTEDEAENLLAGKFKDVNSLEESYKNLESKFTETAQKLSAVEKIFAHDENGNILYDEAGNPILISNTPQQGKQEESQKEDIISEEELVKIQEKFEEDPAAAVKELTEKIADKLVEEKLQEKLSPIMSRIAEEDEAKLKEKIDAELQEMEKIPEFVEHKEEIAKMFDKYPGIAESEKPYEAAYKLYMAENIEKYIEMAQQQGVNKAIRNIKSVEASQVETGKTATQTHNDITLTETEKRMARQLGLTDEEFLEEIKKEVS